MNEAPAFRRPSPLGQLILTRVREFLREPAAVFWVYIFPVLMMVALGAAFRERPIEKQAVAIEQGPGAESLLQTLKATDRFEVKIRPQAEAQQRLRAGRLDLVVAKDKEDRLAFHFDPTKPGGRAARNAANDALQKAAGRQDPLPVKDQEVREKGARYIDYLIPGLLGMGLMGGGMWGVGFAIVNLRIRKLLKRMLATPMKRTDFLASMLISRLLFTIPEVFSLLLVGWLIYGARVEGDLLSLSAVIVLGAFQFAGIGLLVASRAETIETVSGLMNLVMLPMWIAGGVFFPIERFPEFLHPLLQLLPLVPLNQALRGVMLEGASLLSLGPQLLSIVLWGAIPFAIALKWFRWN